MEYLLISCLVDNKGRSYTQQETILYSARDDVIPSKGRSDTQQGTILYSARDDLILSKGRFYTQQGTQKTGMNFSCYFRLNIHKNEHIH